MYRNPFGIHFCYLNQVDDHNKRFHAWAVKFWLDQSLAFFLEVNKVNFNHAKCYFKEGGAAPTLKNIQAVAKYFPNNTIGLVPGDTGKPDSVSRRPLVIPCELVTV